MLKAIFLACLAILRLEAAILSEESWVQRVQAHLLIHDFSSACLEAQEGMKQHPQSQKLCETLLQALAKKGDEREMWAVWEQYNAQFPDAVKRREVLEILAWGVIDNGARSPSPILRVIALMGAFHAQDAKGIALLQKGLSDPNALVRAAAVKLSSQMRDAPLQDEMLRLFQRERHWQVRLEVIRALGDMHIKRAQADLVSLVANSQDEEKAAAIQALVTLLDTADRDQVAKLASSQRSGLRLVACELVEYLGLVRDADLLRPLTSDTRAEVRAAAWHALGTLRVISSQDSLNKALSDKDPHVAVTAAWALTLQDPQEGQEALQVWLKNPDRKLRALAAAATSATGLHGLALARRTFATTEDPYVRLNLALGLLGQRIDCIPASEAIAKAIFQIEERIMWDHEGGFRTLSPSTLKQDEAIPNYPEAVNQLVRLELLNRLAILRYPGTQQAIRKYLQERRWEIGGMAAILLLTEGDETALDAVQELLKDSDKKVRTEAALILSLWGRGEEALAILQESYITADREMKEKILEGLGRAGAASSIPFLVEKLKEPYPALRLIAAASLLETLYH